MLRFMILIVYQILLFLIICLSFILINTGYLVLSMGTLTSISGIFVGILVIYYLLLYHSPEYNDNWQMKRTVHIISLALISISIIFLIDLVLNFL